MGRCGSAEDVGVRKVWVYGRCGCTEGVGAMLTRSFCAAQAVHEHAARNELRTRVRFLPVQSENEGQHAHTPRCSV